MSCRDTQMTWSLIFKESHKTLKARAIIKAEKTSQRLSLSAEWTSRLVDTVLIQLRSPPRTSLKGLNLIADRVSQQSVIRARLRQALQSSTRDTKLWLEAPWVKSKLSYQMISWTTVAQMSVAITERAIMDKLFRHRLQKWQYRMYQTQPRIRLLKTTHKSLLRPRLALPSKVIQTFRQSSRLTTQMAHKSQVKHTQEVRLLRVLAHRWRNTKSKCPKRRALTLSARLKRATMDTHLPLKERAPQAVTIVC